jgi:hypothetical protein
MTPSRHDMWDERRVDRVAMEKAPTEGRCPDVAERWLESLPRSGRPGRGWPRETRYSLVQDEAVLPLDDVQWADWDSDGRLLVATRDDRLQVRDCSGSDFPIRWEVDLAFMTPTPLPPPEQVHRW